ncbi:peptidase inhibitor family I36 protein [Streptomyces sp. IMTB 2501]|uniref:peptidase inhibitor family I36 protein n=1 Tax=Streptomyces sp. IMTB 2501 TaxID=1776340 RepID=UPI0009A19A90|nr:peptidase inhibitor family I36 protein [Streptomyces sp. IMTB 2501]
MSVLRKSLTTAAVAGALLGGIFATPAAAADPNTCPKGKFCGWSGTNRTGTRTVYSETPSCIPLDHIARSASNQTSYTLVFWKATLGCATGTKLVTLKPGTYSDNLGSANSVEIYG